MIVSNHFDVRWVDGYSAVSDVPSSLTATIEKLAADLPTSGDRIELAVRDVRKTDGTLVWIGLLRFVVAVSSAPRPLGFLHAAVLPGSYRMDLPAWRELVSRRYGPFPEERIRTVYEELAESTKEGGRDRLHALAIRPEDLRELLEPLDDGDGAPMLPRAHARPGSRPPKSAYGRPASVPGVAPYARPASAPGIPPPAAPPRRPSQSTLPMSMRVVGLSDLSDLSEPSPEAPTEEMRSGDLPNDITQPMDAPPVSAGPISGEHPQHRMPEVRGHRGWWVMASVMSALAVLLAAVGWLAHRHVALVDERDRLADELRQGSPDREAWEKMRGELEVVKRELDDRKKADLVCQRQVDAATRTCTEALGKARDDARLNSDNAAKYREEAQLRASQLSDANSKLASLKTDLNTVTLSKDEAERQYRDEHQRSVDRDAEAKRVQVSLNQLAERLRLLCKGLQSTSGVYKAPPKECQGIK